MSSKPTATAVSTTTEPAKKEKMKSLSVGSAPPGIVWAALGLVVLSFVFLFIGNGGLLMSGEPKPWEKEVSFKLFKTGEDGKLAPQGPYKTPKTLVHDSKSQVWTNGVPIAFLLPGEKVPICYCSDDKPLHITKRFEGPVSYTKPTKKCWKMCKNE